MNIPHPIAVHRRRSLLLSLAASLVLPAGAIHAQTTADRNTESREDETVVLSPFQVMAERDTGYQATSTLAGTRLRSDLKDIAASISVATKDFMQDVNATDFSSLLTYTLGTEVGGAGGNFSGTIDFGGVYDDAMAEASPSTRVRGLLSADSTRDYFLSDVPMDSYIVDRVEISRGPNAMLFGLGSPAGIINSGLIKANPDRQRTQIDTQFGSYGTYRGTLDHNQVLKTNVLAIRAAAMYTENKYRIEEAFERKKGVFLAATYRPFRNTTIRASTEYGRSDSNRPEMRPPFDAYTNWWKLGKPVFNPVTQRGRLLGTPETGYPTAFNANGTIAGGTNIITSGLGGIRGNVPAIVYSDPTSEEMGITGTDYDGLKPNGSGFYAPVTGTNQGMRSIQVLSTFLRNTIHADHIARLAFNEAQLTDPGVFDFYHHMLHGPTKYEWSEWKTYDATIEQTFLDGRAGIEAAFNQQYMDFGHVSPLGYRIHIDINELLPNSIPNPNFLRPFATSDQSFARRHTRDREAARVTGYFDLDLRETGPSWLGRILGRHRLNGNYMEQEAIATVKGGMSMGNGLDYTTAEGVGPGEVSTATRAFYRVHYLGDKMDAAPTPGSFGPVRAMQFPWDVSSATLLYNKRPVAGQTTPSPWTSQAFNVVTNPREDIVGTSRSSYLSRTGLDIHSVAATVQSYWWDDNLVTTFGWRRDNVKTSSAGGADTDPATGIGIDDWDAFYPLPSTQLTEQSRSFGAVLHMPDFIASRLPFGTNLSLLYNDASNFRVAAQRFDINGQALGPEIGETKEYGVRLSTFNGKLELKLVKFETTSGNATVSSFVGPYNDISDWAGNVINRNIGGFNAGNPAGIAAFEQWLNSAMGERYLDTFNYQLTPNTDSTKPAGTHGSYANADNDSLSHQIVGTSALTSKGIELEVVFNPTKNWRIAANLARAEAVRDSIAPEFQEFVAEMGSLILTDLRARPVQPTAMGALSTQTSGDDDWATRFVNRIYNITLPAFLEQGSPTTELREWRFNAVTNYRFTEGRLKGWSLGANVRWQDEGSIGFPYHIVDGLAVPDVKNPYRSPALTTWGANIGYNRKLRRNVDWSVRLHVQNIGVGNELMPIGAQPDGSVARWLIREPQKWTVTNSFTF